MFNDRIQVPAYVISANESFRNESNIISPIGRSSLRGEINDNEGLFDMRKIKQISDRILSEQEEEAIGLINHFDIQRENPLIN